MFNWLAKCSYFSFEMHVSHIWRDQKEQYFPVHSGSSWVANRHCIKRLLISSICLLFCSSLRRSSSLAVDWSGRVVLPQYFESVRSGRLVLLYYMLKLSSAKCHHFWSSHILSSRPHYINAHNKLQHAWHLLKGLQRQHKGVYREAVLDQNHFCITKKISLVFMF